MKKKLSLTNIVFIIVIALLIITQTRQPILVTLHKGLSFFNQSSIIDKEERKVVSNTNWKLISESKTPLNFNQLEGNIVFVNFWATWCPPCLAEMPSLQSLYNDYKSKVVFLLISNEAEEIITNFKLKNGYNFQVYKAITDVPKELSTTSIPRTFIINKKREIVVDESGAVDWNSKTVRSLLDQLINQ